MWSRCLNPATPKRLDTLHFTRPFFTKSALYEKPLPPRIVVPETDLNESFLKGSGPGGQKINKTSSAVQLKHLPTGIVVKSQDTRSRAQNRKIARRILSDKLEQLEKGPQSRTALKAEKEKKRKASSSKKARRKYRQLDEDKTLSQRDVVEASDDETRVIPSEQSPDGPSSADVPDQRQPK